MLLLRRPLQQITKRRRHHKHLIETIEDLPLLLLCRLKIIALQPQSRPVHDLITLARQLLQQLDSLRARIGRRILRRRIGTRWRCLLGTLKELRYLLLERLDFFPQFSLRCGRSLDLLPPPRRVLLRGQSTGHRPQSCLPLFEFCQELQQVLLLTRLFPVTRFPDRLNVLDVQANQFEVMPRISVVCVQAETIPIMANRLQQL
ncbi:MAG: hypothetical protein CMJ75_10125 [Planctomycetaceae bacterium]|nr:hypothetical protein [Planctomycetaceae bacterium]